MIFRSKALLDAALVLSIRIVRNLADHEESSTCHWLVGSLDLAPHGVIPYILQ
jgi:hypothetical protein